MWKIATPGPDRVNFLTSDWSSSGRFTAGSGFLFSRYLSMERLWTFAGDGGWRVRLSLSTFGLTLKTRTCTVPSTAGMQDPENGVQVVGLGASREAWPVRMAAVPVLLERGLAKRKPPQRLVS